MTAITLTVLLQTALVGASPDAPLTYAAAYHESMETGKPLMVVVGAEWCPACRTLKSSTIPALVRRGSLRKVAFATVDTSEEPQLFRRIQAGGSIPQIILFHRSADGDWKRNSLIGMQSPEAVERLIDKAVAEPAVVAQQE